MRRLLLLLPILMLLAGCGGTGTDFTQSTIGPTGFPATLSQSVDAETGALLRIATHTLSIPPNSLSRDTLVTLTPAPEPLTQPRNADFRSVGPFLRVSLGGATHQGMVVTLPGHHGPPSLDQPQPVLVTDGVYVPLEMGPDGTARVDVDANTDFEVGYYERVTIYPPHVNWGSYNGYLFNSNSGQFEKFITLGEGTDIPNLGPNPLMMVHGLGSDIRKQEFAPMAQYLLDQGVVTGVVGFEYDTLDSIANNGNYLAEFYARLATVNPNARWSHVAHSMGCLVSREAIEKNTLPVAAMGNITAFLCGPHLGSQVINILEGELSLFQSVVAFLVMNDVLDFTNSDGQRCQVNTDDPGFQDLAVGSSALASLNQNADQNHPQFIYNTLAGNDRGFEFDLLDDIIGEDFDDGLVDVSSANWPGLGQASALTAPVSHIQAPVNTEFVFPDVRDFLTP